MLSERQIKAIYFHYRYVNARVFTFTGQRLHFIRPDSGEDEDCLWGVHDLDQSPKDLHFLDEITIIYE